MELINKYVIDVNEYLNKQFQFFAHLKEDKITKEKEIPFHSCSCMFFCSYVQKICHIEKTDLWGQSFIFAYFWAFLA